MIENRPWLTVTSHATLMVGIALVACQCGWHWWLQRIQPPLLVSVIFLCGLVMRVWRHGRRCCLKKPGMAWKRLFFDDAKLVGDGAGDYLWQNCHFVVVCLCHCFLSLSIPKLLFLGHFHDANASCRSTNCTDL